MTKKKKRMEQLINQTEFKYFARKEINWATSPVYFHGRFLTSTELLNKWSENFKKTKRFHFFLEGLVWSGGKKMYFLLFKGIYGGWGSFWVHCVAAGGLKCVCKACHGPELQEREMRCLTTCCKIKYNPQWHTRELPPEDSTVRNKDTHAT